MARCSGAFNKPASRGRSTKTPSTPETAHSDVVGSPRDFQFLYIEESSNEKFFWGLTDGEDGCLILLVC